MVKPIRVLINNKQHILENKRQECILSTLLFNIYSHIFNIYLLIKSLENVKGEIQINGVL